MEVNIGGSVSRQMERSGGRTEGGGREAAGEAATLRRRQEAELSIPGGKEPGDGHTISKYE